MIIGALIDFVNFILDIVVAILKAIVFILPTSPFNFVQNSQFSDFIARINFFIPFYEVLSIMQAWLVAIALYYSFNNILRVIKKIE